MSSSGPLVSVIIPSFNGDKYLGEALQSVWAQTYKNYELIVVDDGSDSDELAKLCRKNRDKILYLRQANLGAAAARNTGIRASRGEYFAFLDDDDLWEPDKLEKQVSLYQNMEKSSMPGLIYTGLQMVDGSGIMLNRGLYKSSGMNFEKLLFIDFIGTPSSVMIKRCVLSEVGLFNENIKGREDYEFWLRIAKRYPVYSLNEYLTRYRIREGTLSKSPDLMIGGLCKTFEEFLGHESGYSSEFKMRLEARIRNEKALRWKNAAYENLFIKGDGKTFREFFRKGYDFNKALFNGPASVFYILSYLSPKICGLVRALKKEKFGDVLVDVDNSVFE